MALVIIVIVIVRHVGIGNESQVAEMFFSRLVFAPRPVLIHVAFGRRFITQHFLHVAIRVSHFRRRRVRTQNHFRLLFLLFFRFGG